jgi:hypothetical protein
VSPALARIAAGTAAATSSNYWTFFLASSANLASQMQAGYHSPLMSTPAVANGFSSYGSFCNVSVR